MKPTKTKQVPPTVEDTVAGSTSCLGAKKHTKPSAWFSCTRRTAWRAIRNAVDLAPWPVLLPLALPSVTALTDSATGPASLIRTNDAAVCTISPVPGCSLACRSLCQADAARFQGGKAATAFGNASSSPPASELELLECLSVGPTAKRDVVGKIEALRFQVLNSLEGPLVCSATDFSDVSTSVRAGGGALVPGRCANLVKKAANGASSFFGASCWCRYNLHCVLLLEQGCQHSILKASMFHACHEARYGRCPQKMCSHLVVTKS